MLWVRLAISDYLETRVEGIGTSEYRSEPINNFLRETMEGVAIEAPRIRRATPTPYTLLQVITGVDLEGDGQNPLGVATSARCEEVVSSLSEQLRLSCPWPRRQRDATLLFANSNLSIRLEHDAF
ncbi:hypothetical protein D3C77_663180 [compost metagenome]